MSNQYLLPLSEAETEPVVSPGSPIEPHAVHGIDAVFQQLDQEKAQEREARESQSFSLGDVNTELVREREREYRDIEKHWVRRSAWLVTAKEIASAKRTHLNQDRGLRYLTLPAYYRLDVALLHQDGLIEVTKKNDATGTVEEIYVAAFESDPTKFGRMVRQVPKFRMFGLAKIEHALTDPKNQYFHELQQLFPFDLINLDLTTSLTPQHEGPYSRTMEAIEAVFERQAGQATPWALFLTFRNLPSDWEQNALDQLFDNLDRNLRDHPQVVEAFQQVYRLNSVPDLRSNDELVGISQAVVKWLTDRGHHYRFRLTKSSVYRYTRYNLGLPPYDIFKHVVVFQPERLNPFSIPTKAMPMQTWMIEDLVACVKKHKCVDVAAKLLNISDGGRPGIMEELKNEIDTLCALVS